MTTANKLTIFRILLVPFFIVEVLSYVDDGEESHRFLAIAAFLLASVCDGVDGYIARRYNQRSELGAILDPLADKLLLVAGIVLLSLRHEQYLPHLPLWLTATVISRDVLLLLGMMVIHFTWESGGETAYRRQGGDGVANGGGMLGVVEAAGGLAPLVRAGRDPMHRCFRCDLRFRRRPTTERQPRQFADTETVSSLKR